MENNHTATHYAGAESVPYCTSLKDNWFVRDDRWQEYAGATFTEYTDLLETGWHRFSLKAPVVPLQNPRVYYQKMLGTVTAYAMSNTVWTYGEGKECTGEFSYDYEAGLITGRHRLSGVLELSDSVIRIEAESFVNNGAKMVVIGDQCEYIGSEAFSGMDLWELAVRANEMEIDENAFEGIDFVYVTANPDSTIAAFAQEHGWAVGDW